MQYPALIRVFPLLYKKGLHTKFKNILANFQVMIYYIFKNIGNVGVQYRKKFINVIESLWCRGECGRVLTQHGLALFWSRKTSKWRARVLLFFCTRSSIPKLCKWQGKKKITFDFWSAFTWSSFFVSYFSITLIKHFGQGN